MSGRGSGRRGRAVKGGVKRGRDEYERRERVAEESEEPAAPLPGGFKSVKARWMSFYENDQKAHGDGRPPRPLSADDSDVHRSSAAEPLPPKLTASAPPSATEAWRKERRLSPAEAAGEQCRGAEYHCSSAQQHSRGLVPREGEKADSKHAPEAAGSAAEAGGTDTKRQKVAAPAAGVSGHLAAAQTMTAAVRDSSAQQESQPAAKASGASAQEAHLQSVSAAAQASDTGQLAGPGKQATQAHDLGDKGAGAAASKVKAGKAAAIHDAAASYAAASKAHSSMQEPLSPKTEPGAPRAVQEHASMKDKAEAVKAEAVMAVSAAAIAPVTVQQTHSAAARDRTIVQGNAEPASASRPVKVSSQQRSEPHRDAATGSAAPSAHAGQSQKALEASAQRKEGSQAKPKSKQAAEQPGSNAAERKQKAKAKDHSTDRSMPSKVPKSKPGQAQVKHQKAQQEPPESERRLPKELRATDGSMPGEGAKIKQQRQERQKAQQDNPESQKVSAKEAAARSTSLSKQPSGTQLLKLKAEQRAADAEDGRLDSGHQDIEAAHLDAASVFQIKKATAPALAAPDAERHVTMSGEERIRAWQTQQESAQRDAAAPAQPTEGHAGSSSAAASASEASRQKGSDASSLERSPGMPLNEQQQQPRQSGNELAIAAAAEQHIKQEGHASADAVKAEAVRSSEPEVSRHPQLAPVEYLGDGSSFSQQLGSVDLSQYDSYRALWAGLRQDYGPALPEGPGLRLVYEDGDGDLVMLQPDEPWPDFLSAARRVFISCR